MKLQLRAVALAAMTAALSAGQSPTDQAVPKFEVASVKPAGPFVVPANGSAEALRQRGGPGTDDPGRITWPRISLLGLLMRAYDAQTDQIVGPAWLAKPVLDGQYAVTATMPPDTSKERFQLMLQNLLAERFQLKLHHETKAFPGYELIVADRGPKFRESTQDPNATTPTNPGAPKLDANGMIRLPPGPRMATMMRKGSERVQFQDQPIAQLAANLGRLLHDAAGDEKAPNPRVTDKTGLAGKYDFTLEFDCRGCLGLTAALRASMPLLAGRGGGAEPGAAPAPAEADDPGSGLPNIFSALEKQLGLKLVKTKDVPVDILVIDHIEKTPTEN